MRAVTREPIAGAHRSSTLFVILMAVVASPAAIPSFAGQRPASNIGSEAASARPELLAIRAATPPTIDGVLDDDAWQSDPLPMGQWRSYNPLHGSTILQQTRVWVAYDAGHLYFAFRCEDPRPDAIKTSVTRRDNIWADDWVGLSLDALGTGQLAYHLMINPSGVQLDMLNSVAGGEDESPDYVWESAGRRNESGYAVEVKLPLQTIRFRGGDDVRMGILFWRRVSRLGISVSWPALDPGTWVFERHAALTFDHLQPRLPREGIPSVTYARRQARAIPARWDAADDEADMGFTGKYGLTPTVTLEATLNPDFSQVESDAFQVEVNQRFPTFYSEKRPFFMEGAGTFTLAGQGSDNSLQRAVHTRHIVDPILGAKLTGTAGRVSVATLTALDQGPGRAVPPGDPDAGKDRLVNIARAQYSLGPGSFAGGLAADSSFAGGYNRVFGADVSWRVSSNQRVTGFVLGSRSRAPRGTRTTAGAGAQAGYEYSNRRLTVVAFGEHYDRDFEMQTAFINRTGITGGWAYGEYSFYPQHPRLRWLLRISPFSFTQGGRDRRAGGDELLQVTGVRFRLSRQGFVRLDRFDGREVWARQTFDRGRWRMQGSVQLYRWLALDGQHLRGAAVYYDPEQPFQGRVQDGRAGFTLQPNGRLSQAFSYRRVSFDRASTGGHVYDLHILYSRTTYQFSRYFFLRAIAQFDSSRHRVLTDFLSSYELRPGTVVYAGYGSLIERRDYVDGRWVPGRGEYATSQRGLFFKASYLHRF